MPMNQSVRCFVQWIVLYGLYGIGECRSSSEMRLSLHSAYNGLDLDVFTWDCFLG